MNAKKFWLSALVVTVAYFLLGGLFYMWLAPDWLAAQWRSAATEPNMGIIALMCLAYGLLMAYTYPLGYRGGPAVKEGLRFGILFALIVNLPAALAMEAMGQCTWSVTIVTLIWELAVGVLLGVITAKLYGGKAATA